MNPRSEKWGRRERTWTDVLAQDGGGDLEDDVADVEDGEGEVVVFSSHPEVLLQACEAGIS